MDLKSRVILLGWVSFGVLFSTTSSQSNLCIGFCTTGSGNTCPTGYSCLNVQNSTDLGCCPIPPQRCIDHNVNCPTWASNGFCANNFFNAANKLSCRKSCGLCTVSPTTTCQDKNTTNVAYKSRNNTLCEIWARNGFCGSKSFYGTYISQNCNYSCGCTNITANTLCSQIAGKGAEVGPCLTGGVCGTGSVCTGDIAGGNGECCAYPNAGTNSLTSASVLGINNGPCNTGFTCASGETCICPFSTAALTEGGCSCVAIRGVTLVCGQNIGSTTIGPAVPCVSGSVNAGCSTTPGQQCVGNACCSV
uniref:ShKT domain-containing protein n=1 Tax=Acrobeloides nanus TaxID=290746 RepID=A0A914DQ47_9BILA